VKRPSRLKRALIAIALLVSSTTLVTVAAASPASAGSCYAQSGSVTDPNTLWHWNTLWYCGNDGGALMYGDANTITPTAYMDSTWSWFVCWRRGAWHQGLNDVWWCCCLAGLRSEVDRRLVLG
jgi:hypothetical protein